MSEAVLLALIAIGEMVITSVVTFLLTRRKYKTEVDNNIINNMENMIENMEKALEFYKRVSDDNKARLDEVLKKNDKLEDEVAELRRAMFEMLQQICTDIMCQSRKREKDLCPYLKVVDINNNKLEEELNTEEEHE